MFTPDVVSSLQMTVDLINSGPGVGREETLGSPAALGSLLDEHGMTGRRDGDAGELAAIHDFRAHAEELWQMPRDALVAAVNAVLAEAGATPRLVRHDDSDWHIHALTQDAPLAERIAVEFAMALVDVIRDRESGRMRVCDGPDCEAVFFDFSKNRSRLYCATGNCGNRLHVAAYRARNART